MTDKEIQDLIDQQFIDNPQDKVLYDRLYNDLSQGDPELKLTNDFKLSVLEQVALKKKQLARERLWIIIGISIFSIAAVISLLLTSGFSMFSSLNGIGWYIVIFIMLYIVFTRLEKKIFKPTTLK